MPLSLQIGGQEQVGSTFKAAGPPGDNAAPEADEAAAGEGAPADEEESAQDMASPSVTCSVLQSPRGGVVVSRCCITYERVLQGVTGPVAAASLLA